MGLFGFGDPNPKVKKFIKEMEKKGYSSTAYRSRKCCENCQYRSSNGLCRIKGARTYPADCCSNWFGKA